jgi:hypothetical protein
LNPTDSNTNPTQEADGAGTPAAATAGASPEAPATGFPDSARQPGATGPTPGSRATGVAAGLSPEAAATPTGKPTIPEYFVRPPVVDLQRPAGLPAVSGVQPTLQPAVDAAPPAAQVHEEPAAEPKSQPEPVPEQLPAVQDAPTAPPKAQVAREGQAEKTATDDSNAQERLDQLVRNLERILSQPVGSTHRPTALRHLRAGRLIAGAIADARGGRPLSATEAFVAALRGRGVELVMGVHGRRSLSVSGPTTQADLQEITHRMRAIRRHLRAEALR